MEELKVIYEDNHIIVVLKPQNVLSQGDETKDTSIFDMVKEYIKVKYEKPGNVFLGLVHRLDRPTGGVMVFAKTSKAASRLTEQMKNKKFVKKYLTVVVGAPRYKASRLEHFLKKDEKTNIVTVVPRGEDGAKQAILEYNTVKTVDKVSLLEVQILTGRSHQIRVQMSQIGTPVFGDSKYGGDVLAKGHNMALWAYELSFEHPTTKKTMKFKCMPPIAKAPWNVFEKEINLKEQI
ncbi:MAG: RluA family pseudouridine synthase [Clostridiales bacterium]|nr:RluA family pseudouridine synthase [Clostridiales bacterium]